MKTPTLPDEKTNSSEVPTAYVSRVAAGESALTVRAVRTGKGPALHP